MDSIRIVITGGGTGGHLFPGVAIAEELASLCHIDLLWIGTGRPVENRILSSRPWKYQVLEVSPLKGRSVSGLFRAAFGLPGSIFRALIMLKRFNPQIVLGVGGYVTGPVMVAARLLGIPAVIHEQNFLPGLANKLSARFAQKIFTSFPGTEVYFKGKDVECLGNPIRRQIIAEAQEIEEDIAPFNLFKILIIGGSQGASGLNRIASSALRILKESGLKFLAIHQTGPRDREEMEEFYRQAGMSVKVEEFIDRIGIAYSWADLIICRAGASTLAEITAVGKPAICIPYPYSSDGHQELNAQTLTKAGACLCFKEEELGAVTLASQLESLMNDPKRLAYMGRRAKALGRPNAARDIALSIMRICCHGGSNTVAAVQKVKGEGLENHV